MDIKNWAHQVVGGGWKLGLSCIDQDLRTSGDVLEMEGGRVFESGSFQIVLNLFDQAADGERVPRGQQAMSIWH